MFHLVFHQIGACAFNQVDEGQLQVHRQFLNAVSDGERPFRHRPRLDPAVVHPDHAADALHEADPDEQGCAGDGFFLFLRVDHISGERVEAQEGHSGVEQPGEPFARRKLTARFKAFPAFLRRFLGAFFKVAEAVDQRQHRFAVRLVFEA